MGIRRIASRAFNAGARWADAGNWREKDSAFHRKAAVRFANQEAFINFLRELTSIPGAAIFLVIDGKRSPELNPEELAALVTERSEHHRSTLAIEVFPLNQNVTRIQFFVDDRRRLQPPVIDPGSAAEGAIAMRLVDDYTVVATARDHREGRQLVDPIDTATDLLNRQVRAAGRRSTTWGVTAGVASGVIAQLVGAALR